MTRSLLRSHELGGSSPARPDRDAVAGGAVTINVNIGNGTNLNLGRESRAARALGFSKPRLPERGPKRLPGAQLRLPR